MSSSSYMAEIVPRMRELLGSKAEGVDDTTLARICYFRGIPADKGAEIYAAQKAWETSYMPLGYIPDKEVEIEFHRKRVFLQVGEKGVRPLVIIACQNHDSYQRDVDSLTRYGVYCMLKGVASAELYSPPLACRVPGIYQFDMILDLKGAAYKNMDVRAMISIFGIIQSHFPGYARNLYVIHVPTVFWGIWRILSPMLYKATKDRIVFVQDKSLTEALQVKAGIDKSLLPMEYGGTGKLVEVEDVVLPNWPPSKASK
eukprot:TRINITY_DN856_c0_g2_i1.p1 TRINITY_DN856_c0_g2~~TRINITY_DN856_c0_g2_i1.p1  ORF type:complete len:257 (-),score=31.13 TRINITY_DN856_c0_g2_i1:177-947(-)